MRRAARPLALELAQPIGISLALLSTLIWSFYWVLNARLSIAPETNLLLNFSGALPLLFGLVWFTQTPLTIPWQGWAGSAYIGLFEMGIAFILWMGAMKATSSALQHYQSYLSLPAAVAVIHLVDNGRTGQALHAIRSRPHPARIVVAAEGHAVTCQA